MSMSNMITDLFDAGLSPSVVREIIELKHGKRVSRLFLDDEQLLKASTVFDKAKLKYFLSPGKIIFNQDSGKGGFSNSGSSFVPDSTPIGSFMVHVGTDETEDYEARQCDLSGNDLEFGRFLGIPECCIGSFLKNLHQAQEIQNDYTLFCCESTTEKPCGWCNPCPQYFGYGLVSYFPCSLTCDPTSLKARETFNLLDSLDSQLAATFLNFQMKSYLYTEFDGVYGFEGFMYDGQQATYDPKNIIRTGKSLVGDLIKKSNRISINDPQDLTFFADDEMQIRMKSQNVYLIHNVRSLDDQSRT